MRGGGGPHPAAIQRQHSAIAIWDGSQKRQGSCIFNCSEEQSLITIIEHSGSLQTHLALLIWEQESTKHKFLFCSLRQKAFFFFSSFARFFIKINKIGGLRVSKRGRKGLAVENETSQCVSANGGKRDAEGNEKTTRTLTTLLLFTSVL